MRLIALKNSEFSRHVLTLMTGTIVAQAIPIAITPILTRMYTPENFGLLALFMAITVIFGSIANGRYELAIMLPRNDKEAINIAIVGLLIAIVFSIFLLISVILFSKQIANLLGNEEIFFWLYFVPFVVLMGGLYNTLSYLNTRKKLYKDIARANVYKSAGMATAQLSFGAAGFGGAGLIAGQIISQLVANYRLCKNIKNNYQVTDIKQTTAINAAQRYAGFPKKMMPATLVNTASSKLVSLGVPLLYSLSTLGFYFLVQRVLAAPLTLVGGAISQVFFQRLSNVRENKFALKKEFWRLLPLLLLISLLTFSILYLVVVDFFTLVFGQDWKIAGEMARVLIPLFAIQFIVSPLSRALQVSENLGFILCWQVLLFLSYAFLLGCAHFNKWSIMTLLENVTVVISAVYFVYLLLIIGVVHRGRY